MDIYSKPGTKVVFLGKNGWPAQLQRALEKFKVGQVLTVQEIEVSSSYSDVKFEEYDGWYNSVMFENDDVDDNESERSDFWQLVKEYKPELGIYEAKRRAKKEMIEHLLFDLEYDLRYEEEDSKLKKIYQILKFMNDDRYNI